MDHQIEADLRFVKPFSVKPWWYLSPALCSIAGLMTVCSIAGFIMNTVRSIVEDAKEHARLSKERLDLISGLRYKFDVKECRKKLGYSFNLGRRVYKEHPVILDMAKRLFSFDSPNLWEAGWIPAKPMSESPNAGSVSEFRESIGRSNELAENESQHHRDPDSCGTELGIIKAVKAKTSALWIIDSGAPHHMTGNIALFSGFVTENDLFVHAANGARIQILARGAVATDAVVLPDVLLVPELTVNLVSISQLAKLDYISEFDCGACYIRSAADGTIVGKAHLGEGGLYVLDFLKVPLAI